MLWQALLRRRQTYREALAHMAFSVILYLDPVTDAEVRSLWQLLSERQISSVMTDMGVRPHVSLAGFEHVEAEAFCQALKVFAHSARPVTVRFEAVGTFPTEKGVVYLAPVVTLELLQLHAKFNNLVTELGLVPDEYYVPGNWVPHCTLAINLTPDEVAAAVTLGCQSHVFHTAALTHIGLVEYMPIREICTFPFGGTHHVESH